MSQEVIKRFIDRVRQQARSQTKTFNMSMDDAQDLANGLALLLLRENELLKEIDELNKSTAVTEIVIGGGTFK